MRLKVQVDNDMAYQIIMYCEVMSLEPVKNQSFLDSYICLAGTCQQVMLTL